MGTFLKDAERVLLAVSDCPPLDIYCDICKIRELNEWPFGDLLEIIVAFLMPCPFVGWSGALRSVGSGSDTYSVYLYVSMSGAIT